MLEKGKLKNLTCTYAQLNVKTDFIVNIKCKYIDYSNFQLTGDVSNEDIFKLTSLTVVSQHFRSLS